MNRSRSKKSKGTQLPLFIQKLIQMLQDSSINHIISWTSTNDSFNIKSISQFTQTILPKFFKHNNFSSFIRQLNMYGFRKIRHDDGQNVYQNQNFKRGNRTLLKNIKRKINQQKDDKLAVYPQQGPSNYFLSRQIQQMKTKQKDLQQICRHLLMQNQKLIDQNNSLMRKMKDQSKKKQRKIQQLLISFMAGNQNKQPILMNGQEGTNNSNMLSIMAGNSSDLLTLNQKNQDTPLQVLSNAFDRNNDMKQFKQLLQNYYNVDNKYIRNVRSTRQKSNLSNQMKMSQNIPFYQGSNNMFQNNINAYQNTANMYQNNRNMFPNQNSMNNNNTFRHEQQESSFNLTHNHNNQFFDQSNEHDLVKQASIDADGFISINDFINLQDENNPMAQEGHHVNNQDLNLNLEESNPIHHN